MTTTEQDIESFVHFARERLGNPQDELSIDALFDQWRLRHPPAEDALAIRASLRDMQSGQTGRSLGDFADEFRAEHDVRGSESVVEEQVRTLRVRGPGQPDLDSDELT